MDDREEAQAVEDVLSGGTACPFCGAVIPFNDAANLANWQVAFCFPGCSKTFYRTKPKNAPGYRVGRYWTTVWEWAYQAGRPRDAKPIRTPAAPVDETSWMKYVNTQKPKRKKQKRLSAR
jgi:hypothetical protein